MKRLFQTYFRTHLKRNIYQKLFCEVQGKKNNEMQKNETYYG